jgi:uncharacterized protein (TIGR00369 family)
MTTPKLIMSAERIHEFLDQEFPQIHADGKVLTVTEVSDAQLVMRFKPNDRHLRPGGTVSGPSMVMLADVAAYATILAHVGPVALAVTTNLNINFLRKPTLAPIFCTCRLLKLGRRLAVVDALLTQDGSEAVAQTTITYSIPPQ